MEKPAPLSQEESNALQKAVPSEAWDRLLVSQSIASKRPRMMTCKQATAELEMTLTSVRRHMKSGRIRVLTTEPVIMVSAEDVEQFAYEKRVKKDAGERRRIDWLNRPL